MGTDTVHLVPPDEDHEKTVELEAVAASRAVEVDEVVDAATPVEVSEAFQDAAPTLAAPPVQAPPEFSRLQPRKRAKEAEIDMTPMVDVTFLLLIFFMVTASFTLQKSLEIPKTPSQDPSTTVVEQDPLEQADFVTVVVDQYNTYQVTTVDWVEEAPSEQDLHEWLRTARSGDSTGTRPTKLRVEAHGDALHQRVVAALDAGTANGFEEVQLASLLDE